MNIRPRLQLEHYQPDLTDIADLQVHIRRAVIEDDEVSARYLDTLLADKPLARIAALHVAQNLYDIRQQTAEAVADTDRFAHFNSTTDWVAGSNFNWAWWLDVIFPYSHNVENALLPMRRGVFLDHLLGEPVMHKSPEFFRNYHFYLGSREYFYNYIWDGKSIPVRCSSWEVANRFTERLMSKKLKTARTPKVIALPAPGQLLVQLRMAI